MECYPQGTYRPRNAQATALNLLVQDNFDELERVSDDRYEKQYGFWRPIIRHVVEQYLECGDLRCGFARLRRARVLCRTYLRLSISLPPCAVIFRMAGSSWSDIAARSPMCAAHTLIVSRRASLLIRPNGRAKTPLARMTLRAG